MGMDDEALRDVPEHCDRRGEVIDYLDWRGIWHCLRLWRGHHDNWNDAEVRARAQIRQHGRRLYVAHKQNGSRKRLFFLKSAHRVAVTLVALHLATQRLELDLQSGCRWLEGLVRHPDKGPRVHRLGLDHGRWGRKWQGRDDVSRGRRKPRRIWNCPKGNAARGDTVAGRAERHEDVLP